MSDVQVDITFIRDKPGGTKGLLTALRGEEVLHSDRMDIAKDRQRTAFLNKLKKRCPCVDVEAVQQLMLNEAHTASQAHNQPAAEPPAELDVSRVVRPHLFHTPEVSGLLVPVVEAYRDQIEGKWILCVQWADGKRECVDLADRLDLGNTERLWLSPRPPSPLPNTVARWTRAGRMKWSEGHTPTLKELFKRIFNRFIEFLEFPREDAVGMACTLSLWALLTYAYPAWPAVPYLYVGGPLGSGKSRVFDVLGQLVFNPLSSSSLTAPCLFRTLHVQGGTLLLDEAERLRDKTPDVSELLSILLAGYRRGGQATRMERVGDNFKPQFFDVYGPKAVAGVSNLPPALVSRCIPIRMFRAAKTSPVPKRRIDPTASAWTELRDDLHCMALTHGRQFVAMAEWQPGCANLNGRELELWLPILAMAQLIEDAGMGGLVEEVERHVVKSIESVNEDIVPEADEILLRLLRQMRKDKPWGVTAGGLLQAANAEEPALFSRYTARGVAAVLNRYGIRSRRSGGKRYFKTTDEHWRSIEGSYGIDLGLAEPNDESNSND